MKLSQNIVVETLEEDRFARTTQITIGEKTFETPNFCTLIQNSNEFGSLIKLGRLSESKYISSCAIRIYDAPTTIRLHLKNIGQQSIADMKSVEEPFLEFRRKTLVIIDPALEYLLFEFHAQKFLTALNYFRSIKQFEVKLDPLWTISKIENI